MITPSDDADGPYWAALQSGRLEMPRCANCGVWQWPAVSRCGECGSWESTWHEFARTGSIFTWTRTHHPFAGIEAPAKPFVTVVVALDGAGGKRLLGRYADEATDPRIGDHVTGEVVHTTFGDREVPTLCWTSAVMTEAAR